MFKEGDRVRLIGGTNAAQYGAEGNVTFKHGYTGNPWIGIVWDRSDSRVNGQMDGAYLPAHFELVPPAHVQYKVGDKITIELTVIRDGPVLHENLGGFMVYGMRSGDGLNVTPIAVRPDMILSHTPAPWVPKVGDVVTSKHHRAYRFKIQFISEQGTWFGNYWYVDQYTKTGETYLKEPSNYELAPSS